MKQGLVVRDLTASRPMRGVPILAPRNGGNTIRPVVGWVLPLDYYDADQGENAIGPREIAAALGSMVAIR